MHENMHFKVSKSFSILGFNGRCGQVGGTDVWRFECAYSNPVASVKCSFDGGEEEECSLPLIVGIERFGTDSHIVVITATDVFGHTLSLTHSFRLTGKSANILFMS